MLAFMKELLDKFLSLLISLFPMSPFLPAIQDLGELPYLSYINWFIPIGDFLQIGVVWGAAVGVYYLYSVVARWIKLIS